MKKALAFLLALCLSIPLFACGEVRQVNKSLSIFVPHPLLEQEIDIQLRRYQDKHPEVDVTVYPLPEGYPKWENYYTGDDYRAYEEDYYRKVTEYNANLDDFYASARGELIAGNGPDLILFGQDLFADVNKAISSGTFAELDEFINGDTDFKRSDYNETVMKAGQFRGKQYTFPLFYDFTCLFTTGNILEEEKPVPRPEGFDITKATDFAAFLQEAVRAGEANPQQRMFYFRKLNSIMLNYSGLDIVDYDKKELHLDTPEFRTVQESIAALVNCGQLGTNLSQFTEGDYDVLKRGEAEVTQRYGLNAVSLSANAHSEQLEPAIMPLRTMDGGIHGEVFFSAAIRANSANKQNAWDFMKFLLADEFQSTQYFDQQLPVKNLNVQDRAAALRELFQAYIPELATLDDSYYENYLRWAEEVDSVVYFSDLGEQIDTLFEPYYLGESSYEACLKKAQSQLMIYVSE